MTLTADTARLNHFLQGDGFRILIQTCPGSFDPTYIKEFLLLTVTFTENHKNRHISKPNTTK